MSINIHKVKTKIEEDTYTSCLTYIIISLYSIQVTNRKICPIIILQLQVKSF